LPGGPLGWSRRALAIGSGVSSGTIKAIEHGLTDPRLSTLRRLAQTFKAHKVEFLSTGVWKPTWSVKVGGLE